jgi:hypothetical protein
VKIETRQIFENRAADFQKLETEIGNKSSLVSWLRVLVFLIGAVLAYYFFRSGSNGLGIATIAVFYIVFIMFMRWHSRLNYSYTQYRILRELNQQEMERLDGQLHNFDRGVAFKDDHHPYTSDLDIFGDFSLFQLLNRSVTTIGKRQLAQWLQKAATANVIDKRQQAVQELSSERSLDWLQHFLAKSRHYKHSDASSIAFFNWLKENSLLKHNLLLKLAMFILPIITVGTIAAWLYGFVSGYIPVVFLVVQYLISLRYQVQRDAFYDNSIEIFESMRSYTQQLKHIEDYTFQNETLDTLKNKLLFNNVEASKAIGKLASIIDFFSYRLSTLMSFFLNTTLMWDFIWIYRLENWQEKHLEQIADALEVLAEFEALASIASFQFANPDYVMPTLSKEPFEFSALEMAHPLIFASERISNNFTMQGSGKTIVVTGSNMSGKTTFLRTIGINMVLAFAGAPVCASKLQVALSQVYTAMRVVDNLAESTSSFYAELKRIRILLDLTAKGEPVFYLLDEILKGTNSKDRHIGAMSLIRQLHKRVTSGLISTHDLELGAMEEELKGSVENYSFNSTIEGDEILFDYKLTSGICRSFNASKLMQLMGIAIQE